MKSEKEINTRIDELINKLNTENFTKLLTDEKYTNEILYWLEALNWVMES